MTDFAKIAGTLKSLRSLHVGSPRDAEFASHLDRLLKRDHMGGLLPEALRFTSTGETRGILVIDGPGGGKSTLVARGLARHPVLSRKPDGHALYLDAVVPSPATLKSMTLELLTRSGYPLKSGRSEVWSQLQVFRERLHMLGIAVLWIDEAHDLFCADRNLILRAVKTLMQGDHAVIVILSGTERLRDIIRTDPQVQRRFSTINLKPVAAHSDKEQFAALIEQYCARAELEPPLQPDLVDRLFHASRYKFGRCIETINSAIEQALTHEDKALDIWHFSEAWAFQEGCTLDRNVFEVPEWWTVNPDATGQDEPAASAKRNRKRRA
ncbi:TniB family NTP-binding protein (plasmid) [Leisingera aquaemixtae]|uniref:TniB family NTP-binding protein n=1 Tax=Leisingera aquaemixtae TaxID=1396826 RepID=UPI003983FD7D